MTEEQARAVVDMMVDDGYEAEVYEKYSGRGTYGSTCAGIVTNESVVLVGYYAAKAELEPDDLPTRLDSMGRDAIVY